MKHAEDIELEPVPGLPEELPEGERIVWQGAPQWKKLARYSFKTRWLLVYFGAFLVVRAVTAAVQGEWATGAIHLVIMAVLFAAALGLCYLLAWLQARATMYTITSHRVVMRIGAALQITWNLPFSRLASADLTVREDDDGDVVLRLVPPDRVAWIHLWPHVTRGKGLMPNPTLRALSEPKIVAARLEAALRHWTDEIESTEATTSDIVDSHDESSALIEVGVRAAS